METSPMSRAWPVRLICLALASAPAAAQTGAPLNLGPPPAPASKAITKQAPTTTNKPAMDPATAVSKANAYFNANLTMVADFVQLSEGNGYTLLSVNADGAGSDFVGVALLEGVDSLLLNDLLAHGNLLLA